MIFVKSLVAIEDTSTLLDGLSYKLHYIFPNASAPHNISLIHSELIDKVIPIPTNYSGIVFACLHVLKNGKLYGKETLPCNFSNTNNNNQLDALTFTFNNQNVVPKSYILMHSTNDNAICCTDLKNLKRFKDAFDQSIDTVNNYVVNETQTILNMQHIDPKIEKLHSVQYNVSGNPRIYLPFFTMTMRGRDLFKNIPVSEIGSWKRFFEREFFPPSMNQFMKASNSMYEAIQNRTITRMKPVLKFIYEYITSLFSGVVRQYITYKQDNTATEYRDYVGIVQPNAYQAFADCEDIAQIGHDLVKIFRRLYPDINIHTRMTEHLPHISYWLKQCDVYMVQGSVGSAQDTFLQSHVWTMICPTKILDAIGIDAGSFIIEGTGEARRGLYQYVQHVWSYDNKIKENAMMLTDKKIGVRMHEILENNLTYFLKNNSMSFSGLDDDSLNHVLALNPQEYHPLRLMIKIHKNRPMNK